MTDIALRMIGGTFDLAVDRGDLAADDGLATAITISLFTDARARTDDPVPAGSDPRGWWGDAYNDDPDDRIGSRLWTLAREKLTAATALRARDMVREALAWLVKDQVASAVDVEVTLYTPDAVRPTGAMLIAVTVTRPDGPARQRYDFVWDATAGALP